MQNKDNTIVKHVFLPLFCTKLQFIQFNCKRTHLQIIKAVMEDYRYFVDSVSLFETVVCNCDFLNVVLLLFCVSSNIV